MIDNTLFGPVDKIQVAIDRIKDAAAIGLPVKVAFSGGKDSICIYRLAQMAGIKLYAQYNDTTVDPPELKRFIKDNYPNVIIRRPKRSMFQLIQTNGPPMRIRRWCCKILKEKNDENETVITGIRHEESSRRKCRHWKERNHKKKNSFFVHPIINWTFLEVWNFIEEQNLKYCDLYDEGWDRIGCILCPMTGSKPHLERWPKMANAYKRSLYKYWIKRGWDKTKTEWPTFQNYWLWWLDRDAKAINDKQVTMF